MESTGEQISPKKGSTLGYVSFAIAVFLAVVLALTFIYPGTPSVSYAAVVVGIGTIVATIFLAIALLS